MHCIQVWAHMPVRWEQAAWSLWDTHSNMPNHRPGQEAGTAARHSIQQTRTISQQGCALQRWTAAALTLLLPFSLFLSVTLSLSFSFSLSLPLSSLSLSLLI